MSRLFATAGAVLSIGTAPMVFNGTDFSAADFAGVTWKKIGGTTNLGSAGDTSELISSNHIDTQRTRKTKGTRNAGQMQVVSDLDYADEGQLAVVAAEKSSHSYPFKVTLNDAPPPASSAVTISIASPGVVTWANHGLAIGARVKFSTTGALPTGLAADTTYFVLAAGFATGSFRLGATAGGAAIETTGAQNGTHTATSVPNGSERYFTALVMSAAEQLDEANNTMKLNQTLEIDSNIVRVQAAQG